MIRVLSLFDGLGGGRIALKRANRSPSIYFRSEIDKYANFISRKNFPDSVDLGDVMGIKGDEMGKIDLLLGGSPCQSFSRCQNNRLKFDDPRGKLFFEYARLNKELNPKYFLLENVRMDKESQDVISQYLGVEPTEINSSLVSAQNRRRLYWTNIPLQMPKDKGLLLRDVVELEGKYKPCLHNERNKRHYRELNQKSLCCIASMWKGAGNNGCTLVKMKNSDQHRKLTPLECERLQTLPENYTCGVSDTQRYKMIGNGWTTDIVAHILKGMDK
jgi:site-specific DNA-cytosine methylase